MFNVSFLFTLLTLTHPYPYVYTLLNTHTPHNTHTLLNTHTPHNTHTTQYTHLLSPFFSCIPTDKGPTTHGVPRERLSAAMLPRVPPMDYDIIFPKDELDKANKDGYPPNFKVSSNVFLMLSNCIYNIIQLLCPACSFMFSVENYET